MALPRAVELIEADLLEDDLLSLVRRCDAVVHIATAIPNDTSAPDAWDAQLSPAHYRHQAAPGCRACLSCSALSPAELVIAYCDGGDAWIDERSPLDDSRARAEVCGPVIEMETMIREVEPQVLAWSILRGGSFVGAGTAASSLVERLRVGEATVAGDGSNFISPVNVADMAAAVAAALTGAPGGSTFNIVDEPLRYGDYVDALADLVGAARPRRIPKLPLPPSWRCTNAAAQSCPRWRPARADLAVCLGLCRRWLSRRSRRIELFCCRPILTRSPPATRTTLGGGRCPACLVPRYK